MADLIEEVDVYEAPVPTAQATQPVDLDDLVGATSGDATLGASAAPPTLQDAFIGGYTPAVKALEPSAPEVTDPRVAWRKKNQEALLAKDKAEAEAKKAFAEKAAKHLKAVQEQHQKALAARRDVNRAKSGANTDAGVPAEGSSWEKVTALVNFSSGSHQKDVTRLKSTLISLKTPVAV